MAHDTSAEAEIEADLEDEDEDIPTIHELRAILGLSSHAVARLLGVGDRRVRRWLDGTVNVPKGVLLRLLWVAYRTRAISEVTPP